MAGTAGSIASGPGRVAGGAAVESVGAVFGLGGCVGAGTWSAPPAVLAAGLVGLIDSSAGFDLVGSFSNRSKASPPFPAASGEAGGKGGSSVLGVLVKRSAVNSDRGGWQGDEARLTRFLA